MRTQPADRGLRFFHPIRARSAADEVTAVLVDAIRGGLYEPGNLLPRERDLADRLGVSRSVVREAIDNLRKAGVVRVTRGHSGGITILSLARLSHVLAGLHSPSVDGLRMLLEARRSAETASCLLAAERMTRPAWLQLEGLVESMAASIDDEESFVAFDIKFHVVVAEHSENRILAESVREIFRQISATRASYPVGHLEFTTALANQRDTLAAVRSRRRSRILRSLDNHFAALEEHFLGRRLTFPWVG